MIQAAGFNEINDPSQVSLSATSVSQPLPRRFCAKLTCRDLPSLGDWFYGMARGQIQLFSEDPVFTITVGHQGAITKREKDLKHG